MFLVGPPGSGKTLLLETFGASPWCIFRSSLTPASLISGYVSDEDPSLIPQLQGKVLVLKDYTEIIGMPRERQEEIYGILRGAYDGHASKTFGNGMHREYPDCHFAMLAGVTDIIHGDDRAALGERFLKFQLVEGRGYDPSAHIHSAITGMAKQVENEEYLKETIASYTNWWAEHLKIPKPTCAVERRLVNLVQIASHIRAQIVRHNRDEIAFRPVAEIGTRMAKQAMKLALCATVVYGKKNIDEQIWALVQKTLLNDTCRGWSLDIARTLANAGGPIGAEELMKQADIPSTTLRRRLEGMQALGAVSYSEIHKPRPGQPAKGWTLTPHLQQLWRQAKIGEV
jgi:hypothetical protein